MGSVERNLGPMGAALPPSSLLRNWPIRPTHWLRVALTEAVMGLRMSAMSGKLTLTARGFAA
jgi:hypothetical protein